MSSTYKRVSKIQGRLKPLVIKATTTPVAIPYVEALQGGVVVSNLGRAAQTTFTLPESQPGMRVSAICQAAQELRLDPDGVETVALANGVQQAAGKYITFDAIGEYVHLVCITAGKWDIENFNGTITAEA